MFRENARVTRYAGLQTVPVINIMQSTSEVSGVVDGMKRRSDIICPVAFGIVYV